MNPEIVELLAHSTHPFTASLRNNEPLYLNTIVPEVRELNDADYSIVHFISTETMDRFGDFVHADGMDDENFKKNPVVFYGHASWGFPVGKSLWRKTATRNGVKGVLAKTQFARTEEGLLCYQLWKERFLNASSIGFLPLEWTPIVVDDPGVSMGKRITGYEFKRWELLEYSIVGVPANPDAVRQLLQKDCMKNPRFRKALEMQLIEMTHPQFTKDNGTEHPTQAAETLVEVVDLLAYRKSLVKSVVDGKVSELTGRLKKSKQCICH